VAGTDRTDVLPHQVFAGRWRIDGKLGEGGMGSVLLGCDLQTHAFVAIKMLGADQVDHPEAMARFERESTLLAELKHPNLVPLLAVSRHEGVPFIVMERIQGQTLERLMTQRPRWTLADALPLLSQLAAALDHLHLKGVVHRDLKPANVIVDQRGHLTLVDLGISQRTDTTRLTLPGLVVGTPQYMAPEQVSGKQLGPASDVYAFALLTWQLLVGSHPFPGDSERGIMVKQLSEQPPLASEVAPDVPVGVAQTLQKSLAKKPDARHRSAGALVRELIRHGPTDTLLDPEEIAGRVTDKMVPLPPKPKPQLETQATYVFGDQAPVAATTKRTGPSPATIAALASLALAVVGALWFLLR
jgi:serine/threonine-protein kinase